MVKVYNSIRSKLLPTPSPNMLCNIALNPTTILSPSLPSCSETLTEPLVKGTVELYNSLALSCCRHPFPISSPFGVVHSLPSCSDPDRGTGEGRR